MHRAFIECMTARLSDAWRRSLDELLHERFSAVRYVWLRRLDKVAQGISHFRADRSRVWAIPRGQRAAYNTGEPVAFDFRAIDHCVSLASDYERRWESHFLRSGLTPLEIVYEEFTRSFDSTLRKALGHLGINHDDLPEQEPELEPLADQTTLEWAQRYREMKLAQESCHK
jgi:LPS sulfotransferase NodH